MPEIPLNHRAAAQMQRGAISPLAIEWLFECGATARGAGGTQLLDITWNTWRRLFKRVGEDPVARLTARLYRYLISGRQCPASTDGRRFRRDERGR